MADSQANVGFISHSMHQAKAFDHDNDGSRMPSAPPSYVSRNATGSRRRPRQQIDWRYPTLAVFLFLAGLGLAIGHHAYYQSLDGTLADSGSDSSDSNSNTKTFTGSSQQTWAIRIGTGMAFLQKTALVGMLAIVGAQQVWVTLRRKAMTIGGIDSMFSVMGNPLALFNGDLLAHAKVLALLALVSWLLPLVAVVTPATLSVQARPLVSTASAAVPAVDFDDSTQWLTTEGAGYIQNPSFDISTLFSNVYSSYSFVAMSSPPSPNSSYEQTLYGPSYRCVSLNEAVATDNAPTWNTTYSGAADYSNYTTLEDAFYGELGVSRTSSPDEVVSVVYSAAAPTYMWNKLLVSAAGTNAQWDDGSNGTAPTTFSNGTVDAPVGSNFVCQLYNTSFRVSVRFDDGVQSVVPLAVDYLAAQDYDATAGSKALLTAAESGSGNGNGTQASATFYVTHLLFTYLLAGQLTAGASGGLLYTAGTSLDEADTSDDDTTTTAAVQTTAPLLQSALVHCPDLYNSTSFLETTVGSFTPRPARCRNATLAAAVEDLSRNFTYSLLTFAGWANVSQTAAVTTSVTRVFFAYHPRALVAAYAAGLGVALVALGLGAHALWRNGVVSSTSFSTALLTTRNPQLDAAVASRCGSSSSSDSLSLGASPLDARIGRLRLRFGHFGIGAGIGAGTAADAAADGTAAQVIQTGFGLDGSVRPLAGRRHQR